MQRVPTLVVLPKSALNVAATAQQIVEAASHMPEVSTARLVVMHDHAYNHAMHDVQLLVQQQQQQQQRPHSQQPPPAIFALLPSLELWPPSSSRPHPEDELRPELAEPGMWGQGVS